MPNMTNPWAGRLAAIAGSLIGLTTISVALRLYARRKMGVRLWIDDWLMIAALITLLAVGGGVYEWIALVDNSQQTQGPPPSSSSSPSPLVILRVLTLLSIFCLGCTKQSACFLYRRIFNVQVYEKSIISILITSSIVVIALWILCFLLLFGLSCSGPSSGPMTPATHQACSRAWTSLLALGITDMILDVWVLALPLFPVFQLQVSLARKISIAGVFLLGAVALSASIARLVISTQFLELGAANFTAGGIANEMSKCFFFLIFECGISIIAINLPIIGPLVMRSNSRVITKTAQNLRSLVSKGSGSSKSSSQVDQARMLASDDGPIENYRPVYELSSPKKTYAVRHIQVVESV